MKDKTHAMNMGLSNEDAERGYGDPGGTLNGQYMTRRQYKASQLKSAGLSDNKAMLDFENPDGDKGAKDIGGFLPRSNNSDRF